jgi:hypothetical protein
MFCRFSAAVCLSFAAPTDPEKGEGWMKGQMLAQPVAIVHARRTPTN